MPTRIPIRMLPIRFESGNQTGTEASLDLDLNALHKDLAATVRGEISFDPGTRGMYAHGASNYRSVPIGVITPLDECDVEAAVTVALKHGVPIIARGAGTSLAGQESNFALLLDFSRHMYGVLEVDGAGKQARVQPGTVLDDLQNAVRPHGLAFGPDPATHSRCTFGGMIGNNSCGVHSVTAGRTSDNVQELEILTYDGHRMTVGPTTEDEFQDILAKGGRKAEIYSALADLRDRYADLIRERYPKIPRRVSGYNLDELLPENGFNVARALVGSESTCALVLSAKVKLIELPKAKVMLALGFPDQPAAGHYVKTCLEFKPLACEGLDVMFFEKMKLKGMKPVGRELLPEGNVWLLVEFGGDTKGAAIDRAKRLMDAAAGKATANLCLEDDEQRSIWRLRETSLGAIAHVPGEKENWEGWEDTAVDPSVLGDYLQDFHSLMAQFGYTGSSYGHYGDGCVHIRIDFDLRSDQGVADMRRFMEEGADLVHRHGGSLTGEHGDGQARGELLTRMYGKELIQAFAEFKAIWDPAWKMNPGKLVAPYKLDENLAVSPALRFKTLETHFKFPTDAGSFGEAAFRCVGAGVCRRKSGGIMCPSFQVTGEEKHSTRGRARLLMEMAQGDLIQDGWKNEEVKEALDLCLSCKGCKSDCPTQVDMATYKAEFLSHYFEGRPRPLRAYAFGRIDKWARLASIIPSLANAIAKTRPFKAMLGVAQQRQVPIFARQTFKKWVAQRQPKTHSNSPIPDVILWPDTFNNHFHPETARAALEVLERAGFAVTVPTQNMCCGRPLYDFGMLAEAKRHLLNIMDALNDAIQAGTPIVVLEPSCAAVFRDELLNLFPEKPLAKKLASQTFLFSEFLERFAPDFKFPRIERDAIVHGHCHHKSIMGTAAQDSILGKLGLKLKGSAPGCCGMAGPFGFEKGKPFDVSIKCGEQSLLPLIRDADAETLIIADGFSCREQIRQGTSREALHLAEVLNLMASE